MNTPQQYDPVWWELRQQEQAAAMAGGRTWREFVSACERRLGVRWSYIREQFNHMPVAGSHD